MTRADWLPRTATEIAFWDQWLGARGDIWGLDPKIFADALDPNLPLSPLLATLLSPVAHATGEVRILDVGSGPLTTVGKRWPTPRTAFVLVYATDALAREYGDLCALHKIVPLVPVHCVDAEALDTLYAPATFDLVHCTNSFDHLWDVRRALEAMLAVTKAGGAVYLRHHVRTADLEHRVGLHQWNLWQQDGAFFAQSNGAPLNLTTQVGNRATVVCRDIPGRIPDVEVIVRKNT